MVIDQGLIGMYGDYFLKKRKEFPDKAPSFRPYRFGFADQWMENLTGLFLSMPKNYLSQHRKLVMDLVERVREKKTYYFFLDALKAVEKRFDLPFPLYLYELKEARPTISSFLMTELLLVWALMEKDGKLLVCVRDGWQRKNFPLPNDIYERRHAVTAIGHAILAVLPFITPHDLNLIPDKLGPLEGVDPSVQLFIPLQTAEEILADAQARQRYVVNPRGVRVEWKEGGGDLREMSLRIVDGVAIAKVITPVCGMLAFLNIETAKGIDFLIIQKGPKNPLTLVLASIYHQLVTAEKIRVGKRTKLSMPVMEITEEKPELFEEQTVVYCPIPRKIVIGGQAKEEKSLLRLPIHHESPRPHKRELKGGEISARQQQRVARFERSTGVSLQNLQQVGCTIVLPRDWEKWISRKVIFLASTVVPQLSQLRAN